MSARFSPAPPQPALLCSMLAVGKDKRITKVKYPVHTGMPEPVFLKEMTYFVQATNGCKLFLVKAHGLQEVDTMHLEFSRIRPIRTWRRQEFLKPWASQCWNTKLPYSAHKA